MGPSVVEHGPLGVAVQGERPFLARRIRAREDPVLPRAQSPEDLLFVGLGRGDRSLALSSARLSLGARHRRRIEPYHLFWLEDPVAHDDYAGLARVADALTAPVAAGEYHYGIVPFRHLLEARAIDVVMIDLLRVGGITQWMKVAGMAEAFNLPVVSHLIPEIHVHLVAAIPNGLTVEYMPWTLRLFEETPALDGGQLVVPRKPGLGLAFDQAAITRYQVG